jgi:hypothetical protein
MFHRTPAIGLGHLCTSDYARLCSATNAHWNCNRHDVWQEAHEPWEERCRLHPRVHEIERRLDLRTDSGKIVYRLTGDNKQFATVAGQQVTVAGDVTRTTIAVETITPAK